jgi:aryl sulfotransferase
MAAVVRPGEGPVAASGHGRQAGASKPADALPQRTREYRSYIFDSRNWDRVPLRGDDIVITTSYKSGTTWMQNLVLELLFPDGDRPAVSAASPWIDRIDPDFDATLARLQAQTHRRVLKSHLPPDGIPFDARVSYIVVVRDPRDVFMSFWNHYAGYTDAQFDRVNASPHRYGPEMPRCPADIRTLWRQWITRGWFPGDSEGWPHSSNMGHNAGWWAFRHLPNILFVHFADMLADLPAEVARIAGFLGIPADARRCQAVAAAVTFDSLRRDPVRAAPLPAERMPEVWKGGAGTFFNKGTNGRWKTVLTADDLALYQAARDRLLTPGLAAFLEGGRHAAGPG